MDLRSTKSKGNLWSTCTFRFNQIHDPMAKILALTGPLEIKKLMLTDLHFSERKGCPKFKNKHCEAKKNLRSTKPKVKS